MENWRDQNLLEGVRKTNLDYIVFLEDVTAKMGKIPIPMLIDLYGEDCQNQKPESVIGIHCFQWIKGYKWFLQKIISINLHSSQDTTEPST